MTARLTITTGFNTGGTETLTHGWPGWDMEVAASVMRVQTHALGGGLIYDLPLGQRHHEAGIVRISHEWTDPDRAATGAVS